MGLADLLIVYGNWRGRFVPARPRRVHLCREFAAELPGSVHAATFAAIAADIEAGVDLTPRLSSDVDIAYVPTAERKTGGGRNRDVDAMLAHDGLHHLHLGNDEGGRFVRRTSDLLFVVFRDDDVYVIGIYPHGAWGRLELLERVVRNWPEVEILMAAEWVTGLTQHFTDDERWQLMKGGVTVLVEIDGKVYSPLGQTTAGTPAAVTRRVHAFMWEMTYLRKQGLNERLRLREADPHLYWAPRVRGEEVGLTSSAGFLSFGRLA